MPAFGAKADQSTVTDIGTELRIRDLLDAYQTARGIAICVKTAEGWFPWYVSHPRESTPPAATCRVPAGAASITPEVMMGGRPPYVIVRLARPEKLKFSTCNWACP